MGLFSKWFGGSEKQKGPTPVPAAAAPAPPPEEEIRWKELSPALCQQKIAEGGVVVLDVRMPQEHESRRIDGSKLIPVQALRQRMGELDRETTYIVHCEHGMRSADACFLLTTMGFINIYEMEGGLASYVGPTVRGLVK